MIRTSLVMLLLVGTTVFSQTFVVVSPNGGGTYSAGQSVPITWTPSSDFSTVAVQYSLDNGASWIAITSWASASAGTCAWNVPFIKKQTTQALVRVVANGVSNPPSDVSDAPFTILAAPPDAYEPDNDTSHAYAITLGDSVVRNAVVIGGDSSMTDTSTSDVDYYKVSLTAGKLVTASLFPCFSSDSGPSYGVQTPYVELHNSSGTVVASGYVSFAYNVSQAGTYYLKVWTIPGSWAKYGLSVKQSDVGTITVISPNGGGTYSAGQSVPITWTPSSQFSTVAVQYSLDNGASWIAITSWASASAGTCAWNVPFIKKQTTQALVRAVANGVSNPPSDVSDAPFTILAAPPDAYEPDNDTSHAYAITLGDSVVRNAVVIGGDSSMTDTSTSDVDYYKVSLAAGKLVTASLFPCFSSDSGPSYGVQTPYVELHNSSGTVVASGYVSFAYNVSQAGTYYLKVWTIPGSWAKYGLSVKQSDVGTITVISPNGGGTYSAGQSVPITWTPSSQFSTVAVQYSLDNGASWIAITSWASASAGTCAWNVPFIKKQTTQALVRAVANGVSNPPSDVSDAPFTILAAPPDAYEPDNDTSHAYAITLGDSVVRNAVVIGGDSSMTDTSTSDVDYYKVSLAAGKLVTASLFPCFSSDSGPSYGVQTPYVELHNSSGTVVASGYVSFAYNVSQTGTYYLKVWTIPGSWAKYGLSARTVAILSTQTTSVDSSNVAKVTDSSGTKYTVGITNDTTKLSLALTLSAKVSGSVTTSVLAPSDFASAPGTNAPVVAISINADPTITASIKAADITIPFSVSDLNGAPESSLVVLWLNDSTNQWTPISFTIDTINHDIVAHTTHFSVYGVFVRSQATRAALRPVASLTYGMKATFLRNRQSLFIRYSLPEPAHVAVRLYNARGMCLKRTTIPRAAAGFATLSWSCADLGSGVYIVDFEAGKYRTRAGFAVMR